LGNLAVISRFGGKATHTNIGANLDASWNVSSAPRVKTLKTKPRML